MTFTFLESDEWLSKKWVWAKILPEFGIFRVFLKYVSDFGLQISDSDVFDTRFF